MMKVVRWRDSLAVRLPASIVEALELREGDEIELHVAGAHSVARKPARDELLMRLRVYRGKLPPDFKFDRYEASFR